jgi:hypothetical protein
VSIEFQAHLLHGTGFHCEPKSLANVWDEKMQISFSFAINNRTTDPVGSESHDIHAIVVQEIVYLVTLGATISMPELEQSHIEFHTALAGQYCGVVQKSVQCLSISACREE